MRVPSLIYLDSILIVILHLFRDIQAAFLHATVHHTLYAWCNDSHCINESVATDRLSSYLSTSFQTMLSITFSDWRNMPAPAFFPKVLTCLQLFTADTVPTKPCRPCRKLARHHMDWIQLVTSKMGITSQQRELHVSRHCHQCGATDCSIQQNQGI